MDIEQQLVNETRAILRSLRRSQPNDVAAVCAYEHLSDLVNHWELAIDPFAFFADNFPNEASEL